MIPVPHPEIKLQAAVGRGRRPFDAGLHHRPPRSMTERSSSIGGPPIVGGPVSRPVPGDRLPLRSEGAIAHLRDPTGLSVSLTDPKGPAFLRPGRRFAAIGFIPEPDDSLRSRTEHRFCAADISTGGGLHRWATERFQMTRFPVIHAASERYRPSQGRVCARRRDGRRPGFQGWAGASQYSRVRWVCREQYRNIILGHSIS